MIWTLGVQILIPVKYLLGTEKSCSIAFTFAQTKVNRINLFFYNIPPSGIGLPPAELYWGNTDAFFPENFLSHVIVGNQNLSQDDRTPRNVSLVVTTDQNNSQITDYRHFGICFTFPETSLIDWILLSEVQLCREAGVLCVCVFPSPGHPSTADEAWYWPKCVLRSG